MYCFLPNNAIVKQTTKPRGRNRPDWLVAIAASYQGKPELSARAVCHRELIIPKTRETQEMDNLSATTVKLIKASIEQIKVEIGPTVNSSNKTLFNAGIW
jgi:hypothetical protein